MQTPEENADNGYQSLAELHSSEEETPTESSPEPEVEEPADEPVPSALIDNDDEDAEGDEADDGDEELPELDPLLKENPEIARLWEQKQKGIQKLANRMQEKEAVLESKLSSADTILDTASRLFHPETARSEYLALRQQIKDQTGVDPLEGDDYGADGGSKYGLKYDTDDAVVEAATTIAEQQIQKKFGKSLEYVEGLIAKEQLAKTAGQHVPKLQDSFGAWVTTDMVEQALRTYPTLTPEAAFGAVHAKRIARETDAYRKRITPKEDRKSVSGAKAESHEKNGNLNWGKSSLNHEYVSLQAIHSSTDS